MAATFVALEAFRNEQSSCILEYQVKNVKSHGQFDGPTRALGFVPRRCDVQIGSAVSILLYWQSRDEHDAVISALVADGAE
jgi:hypothetical protein